LIGRAAVNRQPGDDMTVAVEGAGLAGKRRSAVRVALLCGLIYLFAGSDRPVAAQDFERYKPRMLPAEPGRAELPPPPELPGGDPTIVLQELKSLVIVADPERVVTDRALTTDDYPASLHFESHSSVPLLRSPHYRQIVDAYLTKPVSIERLNDLVRETIQFYRRNDRPVVDVSIPEQNIKNGVIQLVVVEGKVGQVRVEGARWFNPDVLLRKTYTPNSRTIRESTLLSDVDWLNQNPFRRVDLELRPGKKFGETDVIFNVDDRFPMQGYIGYEDTGTQATELERLLFGFNYGNAFGRDHQLAYQYTASPDFRTLSSHTAIYSIPLLNRDTFSVFGSYATVASTIIPFNQDGLAWQASWRYKYVLDEWRSWKHNFNVGFDFKLTNTNLDFGGNRVFASAADVAQMAFGYQAARQDTNVATAWGTDFYVSPGQFSSGNSDANFNVIRPGAKANYLYNRTFIEQ
jgi:hemolysin activation/secretion protein